MYKKARTRLRYSQSHFKNVEKRVPSCLFLFIVLTKRIKYVSYKNKIKESLSKFFYIYEIY